MKKIILFSLTALFATTSMASNNEALKAVLDSKAVDGFTSIKKLEVVETYRCPGCFAITVTGRSFYGDAYVKVRTMQTGKDSYSVQVVEQSK